MCNCSWTPLEVKLKYRKKKEEQSNKNVAQSYIPMKYTHSCIYTYIDHFLYFQHGDLDFIPWRKYKKGMDQRGKKKYFRFCKPSARAQEKI